MNPSEEQPKPESSAVSPWSAETSHKRPISISFAEWSILDYIPYSCIKRRHPDEVTTDPHGLDSDCVVAVSTSHVDASKHHVASLLEVSGDAMLKLPHCLVSVYGRPGVKVPMFSKEVMARMHPRNDDLEPTSPHPQPTSSNNHHEHLGSNNQELLIHARRHERSQAASSPPDSVYR